MRRLLLIPVLCGLAACGNGGSGFYQGYVEGKYVQPAPAIGGRLIELAVREGQRVREGDLLFALDAELEQSAVREAEQRAEAAAARFQDLNKGKRAEEIDVARAAVREAEAALSLATADLKRARELFTARMIPQSDLDAAESAERRAKARLEQLRSELRVAELAGRSDQIVAAQAELEAAMAAVSQAQWALDQKTVRAQSAGVVEAVYHRRGEWVGPGSPVLSLLPETGRVVRFFVPEGELAGLRIGQVRDIVCDGCPAGLKATVSYISPEAEYTPPVIYSRHHREKLVFLVEATIEDGSAAILHPGLPVEVHGGD
jgi:HlyD family secretion protein